MNAPLTPGGFREATNVSRETLARLELYANLLRKWNRRINLVSRGSIQDLWRRHMLDSAQLIGLLPPKITSLVDLGSGAGFPGMVLAICGVENVHLIEADGKKIAFLREVARATGTRLIIHHARIEEIESFQADVITSRALAPLPKLLDLASSFVAEHSILLFLKGRGVNQELTEATKEWNMTADRIPSRTDPEGTILRLEAISRARHFPE